MLKKKGKFVLLGISLLSGLALTSCSKELRNAQAELNDSVRTVLNESQVVKAQTDKEFEKFVFLGADFDAQKDNSYLVNVSGISKVVGSDKSAYVNLEYKTDMSYFSELSSKDLTGSLRSLKGVVDEFTPTSFAFVEMNNINSFNSALSRSIECPIKDYGLNNGFVYSVSNLDFNEEKGYVSFQTKEDMKYDKTETEVTFGITGFDKDGNPEYGTIIRSHTYYENFFQTTNVYVKANADEIAQMKEDTSKVFDKFVELVSSKDKSNYVIESYEVQKDQIYETSMKGNQDLKFEK